ncbi:hypothetical protein [Bacillus altitudinis]|uniref:hypothetical protein n=1 Tax=Bacillus altitudinis TaxID=293387 RepID=UPI003D2160EB
MADNIQILNSIRLTASELYKSRIPLATRENIVEVGNEITNWEVSRNEVYNALINRIGKVIIRAAETSNPLAVFKKGQLEYGMDIEDVWVDLLEARTFDAKKAEEEIFKTVDAKVLSVFHRENRRDKYKVTTRNTQLKKAFLNPSGLQNLVQTIVSRLYASDTYDEFILAKNLISTYDGYHNINVGEITGKESMENFVRAVRLASTSMTFVSDKYNKQKVKTTTPVSKQVLIIHKDIEPVISVDVLAWAFNQDKANFNVPIITVDDFGEDDKTYAKLIDREFLMIYDTNYETSSLYNNDGLYTNHWLHHWQLYSHSPFLNAVSFNADERPNEQTPVEG